MNESTPLNQPVGQTTFGQVPNKQKPNFFSIFLLICITVLIGFLLYKSYNPTPIQDNYSAYCVQFTDGNILLDRTNIGIFCLNQSSGALFCGWSIYNESVLDIYNINNRTQVYAELYCNKLVKTYVSPSIDILKEKLNDVTQVK